MNSVKKKKIMIVAGEISGDLYGAELVQILKRRTDNIEFICIGSQRMEREVGNLFFDSSGWGVIGIWESLKKLPVLYLAYKKIKQFLIEKKPDLLLLIDYPGFNMRLVHAAKKRGIRTLYYIPPSKWAKTPEQVLDAAQSIDKIITTFETTYDLYRKAGADVEYVGHPLLEIVKPTMPVEQIRRKLGLSGKSFTIGLLPGSREKEVRYLLPVLLKAGKLIKKNIPEAEFVVPLTSATFKASEKISEERIRKYISRHLPEAVLAVDETYNVFSALDFAVIASGTATLEAACMNIPMIIIYKVSKITEIAARLAGRLPIVFGLPNIIMGRQVISEFAQGDVNSDRLAHEVESYYKGREKLQEQKKFLKDIKKKMGETGATERAAAIVLDYLQNGSDKNASISEED